MSSVSSRRAVARRQRASRSTVVAVPDGPTGGRLVTVVLIDRDDTVGQIGPLDVATPWWQDMAPIVEVLPGIAVLRLLEAVPSPDFNAGGAVTYLAERL